MDLEAENNTPKPNHGHDIHGLPPQDVCDIYKKYQKMHKSDIDIDPDVIDFSKYSSEFHHSKVHRVGVVSGTRRRKVCETFDHMQRANGQFVVPEMPQEIPDSFIYEHVDFPGLQIYPGLLPQSTQVALSSRLLHVDLSDPIHKTNLHNDYELWYPSNKSKKTEPMASEASPLVVKGHNHRSFFSLPQFSQSHSFQPKNPEIRKSLNTAQLLRTLRWLTIGSQYDWATRRYPPPSGETSSFPACIRDLVSGFFPSVRSESGVILLYSPKDFMPVHRDVSEESPRAIVSISLGCDGIFIIAGRNELDKEGEMEIERSNFAILRVRSGDIVHMAGETRFAWHALCRVLPSTCPPCLANWPVVSEDIAKIGSKGLYDPWKGWMASKRLNISCRQVWE